MTAVLNKNCRTVKRQKELEYSEKLRVVDAELLSFYQYCQQMGFTDAEMEVICAPLLETVRKNTLKKVAKAVVLLMLFGSIIYGLSSIGTVAMHFTALGRIFLIKVSNQWQLAVPNC